VKDAVGNEVELFDTVAYIHKAYGSARRLKYGVVIRFTPKSMEVAYAVVDKDQQQHYVRNTRSDLPLAKSVSKIEISPLTNPEAYAKIKKIKTALYEDGVIE